jgi:hypothetical protein
MWSVRHSQIVSCLFTLVLTACGALAKLGEQSVERPAHSDCVRYQFVLQRPHLGGDRWGPVEFADLRYPAGPGSERLYGAYAACPKDAGEPDADVVAGWAAWRKLRMQDRQTYWAYNEQIRDDGVRPIALVSTGPAHSESEQGTLYKVELVDAYFQGCDYWASESKNYKCAP